MLFSIQNTEALQHRPPRHLSNCKHKSTTARVALSSFIFVVTLVYRWSDMAFENQQKSPPEIICFKTLFPLLFPKMWKKSFCSNCKLAVTSISIIKRIGNIPDLAAAILSLLFHKLICSTLTFFALLKLYVMLNLHLLCYWKEFGLIMFSYILYFSIFTFIQPCLCP